MIAAGAGNARNDGYREDIKLYHKFLDKRFFYKLLVKKVPDIKHLGCGLIRNGRAKKEITSRIIVARNVLPVE